MRVKLSDAEFVERARASARRRSERQRLRKLESGKIQVNHWLTAPAKERLDALATELNASPSEVVTAAILSYRQPLTTTKPATTENITSVSAVTEPAPCPVDAKTAPESLSPIQPDSTEPANASTFNQDLGAFKTAVADCWNAGVRGYGAIATALNNAGYRNGNGNPYPRSHVKSVLVKAGLVSEKPDKGE